jgi:hypothetical protein
MENQCIHIDLNFERCKNSCKCGKLCPKHDKMVKNRKLILEIVEDKLKLKDIDHIVYYF